MVFDNSSFGDDFCDQDTADSKSIQNSTAGFKPSFNAIKLPRPTDAAWRRDTLLDEQRQAALVARREAQLAGRRTLFAPPPPPTPEISHDPLDVLRLLTARFPEGSQLGLHTHGDAAHNEQPRNRLFALTAEQLDEAAAFFREYDGTWGGVHFTMNPVRGDKRHANGSRNVAAVEADVPCFRWLGLDCDPKPLDAGKDRPKTAATEEERQPPRAKAFGIAHWLKTGFGIEGLKIDSGNGATQFLAADLPNDDAVRGLIKRLLTALDARFPEPGAELDLGYASGRKNNRVPGSLNRKGEETEDRKHRRSRIKFIPETPRIVDRALLEAMVAKAEADLAAWRAKKAAAAADDAADDDLECEYDSIEAAVVAGRVGRWLEADLAEFAELTAYRNDELCKISKNFGGIARKLADRDGLGFELFEEILFPKIWEACVANKSVEEHGEYKCRDTMERNFRNAEPRKELAELSELLPIKQQATTSTTGKIGEPVPDISNVEPAKKVKADGEVTYYLRGRREVEIHPRVLAAADGQLWNVAGQLVGRNSADEPEFLSSAAKLFAYIGRHASVFWKTGAGNVSQERYFESLRMRTEGGPKYYTDLQRLPHFPPRPETLYIHPQLPATPTCGLLDQLVDCFAPATRVDRSLIKAFFMTPAWGGEPSQRPLFTVESTMTGTNAGRGDGKTTLVELVGRLYDGYASLSAAKPLDDFLRRYLSNSGGQRVVLLDNLKSRKLSWDDLEKFVTTGTISGHRMFVGEGRMPNLATLAITGNAIALSKDLASRAVPIRIGLPNYDDSEWAPRVRALIDANKWALLAEIGQILGSKGEDVVNKTRWAEWEVGVLSRCGNTQAAQEAIASRRIALDGDLAETDAILEAIADKMREVRTREGQCVPELQNLFIPSQVVARWLTEISGARVIEREIKQFFVLRNIRKLTDKRFADANGWVWWGGDPAAKIIKLSVSNCTSSGYGSPYFSAESA